MARRLSLACLIVLCATDVLAQRAVRRYDLDALGWGAVTTRFIDIDGDPLTEEYLVEKALPSPENTRVIAIRDGRTCVGRWFDPWGLHRPNWPPSGVLSLKIERIRGTDHFVRIDWDAIPELWGHGEPPWPYRTSRIEIALDMPSCQ